MSDSHDFYSSSELSEIQVACRGTTLLCPYRLLHANQKLYSRGFQAKHEQTNRTIPPTF